MSASNKVGSNSGDNAGVEQAKMFNPGSLALPVISTAASDVPVTLSETREIAHFLLILSSVKERDKTALFVTLLANQELES